MKSWRNPDFVVGGDRPYLLRWYLLPRNRLFNIYLHKFVGHDEDRALHDHPWPSASIVLSGGYFEHTPDGRREWYGPGNVLFRRASYTHRIELDVTPGGVLIPCWTLFMTGPRVREWGFHCPKGWRHWKEFCDERDSGKIGRGCD